MENLNLNILIYPFIGVFSIIGVILKQEKKIFKILAFLLVGLSMIRFDTGYDYYWYYAVSNNKFINNIQIQRLYKDLELGIKKIIDLSRYLNHSQYFFAITAVIILGLILYTIHRDSKSPLISLTFFMFLEMGFLKSNELIMQYCALAICFYSIKYAYEKRYIIYIILVLLASLGFHKSSILCVLFIFVPKFKIKNIVWGFYTLFCFIFLGKIIPNIVQKIIPEYYYIFSFSKEKIYAFKDIKMSLLLIFILFILDLKIKNRVFKIREQESYIIYQKNIFIVGSILAFSLAYYYKGHTGFRIGVYFMIYYLNLVGEYSNYISPKIRIKLKVIIILILNVWFIRGMFKYDVVFLNKKVDYKVNKKVNMRPNSGGFKFYFGKTENDLDRYLPNNVKHIEN